MNGAEVGHKTGTGSHSEAVMTPGHAVRLLIKPAQRYETQPETSSYCETVTAPSLSGS